MTERWRQYCEALYNHNRDVTNESLREVELSISHGRDKEPTIMREKIEKVINLLKCNKSPGRDNIPSELIKCGGKSIIEVLLKICNTTLTTGEWPSKWTESIVIPIPKK